MTVIESDTQFRQEAAKEKLLCVFFTAEACPDCRVLDALMPGLEKQFENQFTFARIDRDRLMGITDEFEVVGIPSLVVFHEGRVVGRYNNRLRKTRAQFVDFLEEIMATEDA